MASMGVEGEGSASGVAVTEKRVTKKSIDV